MSYLWQTFFRVHADQLLSVFGQMNTPVLWAAERLYSWQNEASHSFYDQLAEGRGPYRYLNGGGYMGYASALLPILENTVFISKFKGADQMAFSRYFAHNWNQSRVKFDYDTRVFYVASADDWVTRVARKRVSDANPCHIHVPYTAFQPNNRTFYSLYEHTFPSVKSPPVQGRLLLHPLPLEVLEKPAPWSKTSPQALAPTRAYESLLMHGPHGRNDSILSQSPPSRPAWESVLEQNYKSQAREACRRWPHRMPNMSACLAGMKAYPECMRGGVNPRACLKNAPRHAAERKAESEATLQRCRFCAAPRPIAVLFYHLRKCAGTTVRRLFEKSCGCNWTFINYCMAEEHALPRVAMSLLNSSRVFWENHCSPRMRNISMTVAALRAMHHNTMAFTVLRHPVDMVFSEHAYFAKEFPLEAFIRGNPEMLLHGDVVTGYRFLGYGPSNSTISHTQCEMYLRHIRDQLAHLDHIAFLDVPESFQPIESLLEQRWPSRDNVGGTCGSHVCRPASNVLSTLARKLNSCSIHIYLSLKAAWRPTRTFRSEM